MLDKKFKYCMAVLAPLSDHNIAYDRGSFITSKICYDNPSISQVFRGDWGNLIVICNRLTNDSRSMVLLAPLTLTPDINKTHAQP